jgi:hypothetical protein
MGGGSFDSRVLAGLLGLAQESPVNWPLPLTLLQQQVATNQLVPPTAFGMPPVALAGAPPPVVPAAMAAKPPPIVK